MATLGHFQWPIKTNQAAWLMAQEARHTRKVRDGLGLLRPHLSNRGPAAVSRTAETVTALTGRYRGRLAKERGLSLMTAVLKYGV